MDLFVMKCGMNLFVMSCLANRSTTLVEHFICSDTKQDSIKDRRQAQKQNEIAIFERLELV